jgi:hypothetical protein
MFCLPLATSKVLVVGPFVVRLHGVPPLQTFLIIVIYPNYSHPITPLIPRSDPKLLRQSSPQDPAVFG